MSTQNDLTTGTRVRRSRADRTGAVLRAPLSGKVSVW
jgi:hypothetical protein